jgi:hypothetical protein
MKRRFKKITVVEKAKQKEAKKLKKLKAKFSW